MSRLRVRTLTPFERECMWWWRNWKGDGMDDIRECDIPMREFAFHPRVQALAAREVFAEAERIMRTKGVDLPRACRRALGDVETHIDPVTGMGYKDLHDVENARDSKRRRDGNARWLAWRGRIELSRYANRKYPLKRHAPVSRVQISAHEDWFLMERWVPSENPNIFVKVRLRERTTITKTEVKPADAPDGKPWEVLK